MIRRIEMDRDEIRYKGAAAFLYMINCFGDLERGGGKKVGGAEKELKDPRGGPGEVPLGTPLGISPGDPPWGLPRGSPKRIPQLCIDFHGFQKMWLD